MSIAGEMVQESIQLVSLPEIYLRVKQILGDEKAGIDDVANVVSRDPGLTTRILSIANSAFYGVPSNIENVSRAINLLGGNKVHDIVLATTVCRSFDKLAESVMNMDTFWQNSIYRAVLSHLLADHYRLKDCSSIFIKGLLADIGHLAMYYNEPELCETALLYSRENDSPLFLAENKYVGCNYAYVGGLLLESLGLPRKIHLAVYNQITPYNEEGYSIEASILGIASQVTDIAHPDIPLSERPLTVEWDSTGLDEIPDTDCIELRQEADKETQESLSLIYPGHTEAA